MTIVDVNIVNGTTHTIVLNDPFSHVGTFNSIIEWQVTHSQCELFVAVESVLKHDAIEINVQHFNSNPMFQFIKQFVFILI